MKNNKKLRILFYILILLTVLTGTTYAFFNVNLLGENEYSVSLNGLVFKYTESAQGLSLTDPGAISDDSGIDLTTYFDFSVYASTVKANYTIYLKVSSDNTIANQYVKVALFDQNENVIVEPTTVSLLTPSLTDSTSYELHTATIDASTSSVTQKYRLRAWVSSEEVNYSTNGNSQTGMIGGRFSFKVNISKIQRINE